MVEVAVLRHYRQAVLDGQRSDPCVVGGYEPPRDPKPRQNTPVNLHCQLVQLDGAVICDEG